MSRDIDFLHPILDVEKALSFTPPPEIDFSKIPEAPNNWQSQLEEKCCQYDSTLQNPFKKHIDKNLPAESYVAEKELKDQLKIIYHRLAGDLDSQIGKLLDNERTSILLKLTEGIQACTAGFHNRVNAIVTSMQLPSSLAQLLYQVRQSLVESTAAALTSEVHATNRVTRVANVSGFGVKINSERDPYVGALSDTDILVALQSKFKSEYTPFNLPILLCDELRGVLSNFGYIGRKDGDKEIDKTYNTGDVETFFTHIANCLKISSKENWNEYFIIEDETSYIRDINWSEISKLFLEQLEKQGYFKTKPIPEQLWQFAYYYPIEETIKQTKELFLSAKTLEDRKDFINQLRKMRSICPPNVCNTILDNPEVIKAVCDFYFSKIQDLVQAAQKKGDYSGILNELKQAKSLSMVIYQELIKQREINQLVNNIITSLVPTVITSLAPAIIIEYAKKRINPPSLVLIAQVFQLLIDTGSSELNSNIETLKAILIKKQYSDTANNFNTAISIVKIMYQNFSQFNETAKILLKEFVKDEAGLIRALKQLPQDSWISLIEIPNMPCSNAFKKAIYFMSTGKMNEKHLNDFLNVYNALEQFGGNYKKNFFKQVVEYVGKHEEILDDPIFLTMLFDIKDESEAIQLLQTGLKSKSLTPASWRKCLEEKYVSDPDLFLDLSQLTESISLRLALAEFIKTKKPIMTYGRLAKIFTILTKKDESFVAFCDVVTILSPDFWYKTDGRDNNSNFLRILGLKDLLSVASENTPESTKLRHNIFKSMLAKEKYNIVGSSDSDVGYAAASAACSEKIEFANMLYTEFRNGDQKGYVRGIVFGISKFLDWYDDSSYSQSTLSEQKNFLQILIEKLDGSMFYNFLSTLDDRPRKMIVKIVIDKFNNPNDIEKLKIYLIAKLTSYRDSHGAGLHGPPGFFTFPRTRMGLEKAEYLIGSVINSHSTEHIRVWINTNKDIFSRGEYRKCLDECSLKLDEYERNHPVPPAAHLGHN